MNTLSKFSERLEDTRRKRGLSQGQLCKLAFETTGIKVASTSISGYENLNPIATGFKKFPTAEKLAALAKTLEVTCDYLLGLSDIPTPDIDAQAAGKEYGLNETALAALSDMPISEEPFGRENVIASSKRADTMTYRKIINLLVSTPEGRNALEKLACYFFATPDQHTQNGLAAFVLPWETGESQTYLKSVMLSEDDMREYILILVNRHLQALKRECEPNAQK